MLDQTVVVAGNGASLARIETGRILEDDFIIRTNNFFFEPSYFLGRRVDLYMAGGDPRVAPFMFDTLRRCQGDYELNSWSSFNPKIIPTGMRRFGPIYQPMRYRDADLEQAVQRICATYDRVPMTGTYAVLMAHAMKAPRIILAGFDYYKGERRYPFEAGRHYQALMGTGSDILEMDARLHDINVDREVLRVLLDRGDVEIQRSVAGSPLDDLLPLAPQRDGPVLYTAPRQSPPTDWVSWAGCYPIELLKVLRRLGVVRRNLIKGTGFHD